MKQQGKGGVEGGSTKPVNAGEAQSSKQQRPPQAANANAPGNKPQQQQGKARAPAASENVNSVANQVYRLALFDHLPRKQTPKDLDSIEEDRILHVATIQLGHMYNKGQIQTDDDRAQALLATIIRIVGDYKTPPMMNLREDLDRYIVKQVQYLVDARQISKGMGNIIRYVRLCVSKISPELSESEAKAAIVTKLQTYLDDKIIFAGESIARNVCSAIHENDVILTFGSSPLLRKALLHTAQTGKKFRLVVVDTRPLNEGLETLSALSSVTQCIYCPLSGAAVAMKDATKVILGASCLLSNGSMLAPAGTAMVASLAKARQIPTIVAAESYKFSDKVQLDSIVFNELGHPSEIVTTSPSEEYVERGLSLGPQLGSGYRGSADKLSQADAASADQGVDTADLLYLPQSRTASLKTGTKLPFEVVNLRYDLTPLSNISVIATETGLIPPTSVPILIRESQSEVIGE